MADIFESTLRLKDFIHKGNPQLVNINDKIELSGFSPYIIAHYHGLEKDYKEITNNFESNQLFDPGVSFAIRRFKDGSFIKVDELTPNKVDTKEYWNFIHTHFPFCDVSSYYRSNDLETYFALKGTHYDGIVEALGEDIFKGKKILEIGPGYGYIPERLFKKNDFKSEYYCADIVKRFDHDNFIEISGYSLSNIKEKFDVIIMQDVVQHLGTEIFKDYTQYIKNNLLVEGGVLVIGKEIHNTFDAVSFFFGQCYKMIGHTNMIKYLDGLGFELKVIPFLLNGKHHNGFVILCKNNINNNKDIN